MKRKQLNVKKETYEKIMIECVKEFKKKNPSLDEIKVTHDFIVNRIARYYLGEKF